jgi:hypothetical protein
VLVKLRVSARLQDQFDEGAGIEKPRIWLTRFYAIPGMLGIDRDGDLFPHLAAHLKVFGNLIQVAFKLIGRGGPIERAVIADGAKERFALVEILAVSSETVPHKSRLAILACVDLALPAFIGPRRSPKPNESGDRSTGWRVRRKQSHRAYREGRVVR